MNKKTKHARAKGFASQKDLLHNGNKVYKGLCCDTAWNAPGSKHKNRKQYKRNKDREFFAKQKPTVVDLITFEGETEFLPSEG
jgi:hypothetical protein